MSTRPDDPLYRIFETKLHSGDYDDQPTDALLDDVVETYWREIQGRVPLRLRETVKADLRDDARDMLRIKIYGNQGVGEYNRRRSKKG